MLVSFDESDVMFERARRAAADVFDPARFRQVHAPVVVAELSVQDQLDADAAVLVGSGMNVLDMPIKVPGGPVLLPRDVPVWVRGLVEEVLTVERRLTGDLDPWHAYLTVHQSVPVSGSSQRRPGAHFDGMQGVAYPSRLPGCHAYLAATSDPTVFFRQSFELADLDPGRDNFFTACQAQVAPGSAWRPCPGQVVLASCYSVHESPVVDREVPRSFARVEFSRKRFDRAGNTVNPELDTAHWDYHDRPIPAHLT